jgi:Uri superfamily endonuclease
LGEVSFKEGEYLYIGSAKSCLERRLQRHLRKEKRIFWHIDYLLENQKVKIFQIWTIDKKVECQAAEVLCQNPAIKIIKKGFGSSDCKCLTHLFFIKDKKRIEKILKEEIGFSVYYSFQNLYF